MNLKNLPISHLSLIITDQKNDPTIRKSAEIELKKRIKNIGIPYDDLLQSEEESIKIRGLNINNYLFSHNPTLQQLMELYFTYRHNITNSEDNHLLFSEKHLCNKADFASPFFTQICNTEIKNLTTTLNTCKLSSIEKETLTIFKQALEERKKKLIEAKKEIYSGIDIITFNEALQFIEQNGILEFGNNLTDEELYRINNSKLQSLKFNMLKKLSESMENKDLYQSLFGLKKVLEDAKKVNIQKQVLLAQSKNGYIIDYNTPAMKLALRKMK